MYVCVYVCMCYVCMYVCTYVICMSVCIYTLYMYVCMYYAAAVAIRHNNHTVPQVPGEQCATGDNETKQDMTLV